MNDVLERPAKRLVKPLSSPPTTFDAEIRSPASEVRTHVVEGRTSGYTRVPRDLASALGSARAAHGRVSSSGLHRVVERAASLEKRWDRGDHTANIETTPAWTLITELRLLTGYAWEQIGLLLGVNRRSVQKWMNREKIRPNNLKRIHDCVRLFRFIDRGLAERNARAMLAVDERGINAFRYGAMGNFGKAAQLAGPGDGWPKRQSMLATQVETGASDIEFGGWTIHEWADGSEVDDNTPLTPEPKRKGRRLPMRRASRD